MLLSTEIEMIGLSHSVIEFIHFHLNAKDAKDAKDAFSQEKSTF